MVRTGITATVQGYGKTERGVSSRELLETNVTVISNKECEDIMQHNTTNNLNTKNTVESSLPEGLKRGIICGQGSVNEAGVVRSSCAGDSGGPLLVTRTDGRKTLIGIVSGGYGCALGNPGWYTVVKFHSRWIKCIVDRSLLHNNNYNKVQKDCRDLVSQRKVRPTH